MTRASGAHIQIDVGHSAGCQREPPEALRIADLVLILFDAQVPIRT
jgi:hypothetical protein